MDQTTLGTLEEILERVSAQRAIYQRMLKTRLFQTATLSGPFQFAPIRGGLRRVAATPGENSAAAQVIRKTI